MLGWRVERSSGRGARPPACAAWWQASAAKPLSTLPGRLPARAAAPPPPLRADLEDDSAESEGLSDDEDEVDEALQRCAAFPSSFACVAPPHPAAVGGRWLSCVCFGSDFLRVVLLLRKATGGGGWRQGPLSVATVLASTCTHPVACARPPACPCPVPLRRRLQRMAAKRSGDDDEDDDDEDDCERWALAGHSAGRSAWSRVLCLGGTDRLPFVGGRHAPPSPHPHLPLPSTHPLWPADDEYWSEDEAEEVSSPIDAVDPFVFFAGAEQQLGGGFRCAGHRAGGRPDLGSTRPLQVGRPPPHACAPAPAPALPGSLAQKRCTASSTATPRALPPWWAAWTPTCRRRCRA